MSMSNTTHYGFYTEDDSATKFQEFRERLNSSNNSNMVKIDEVLWGKADNSVCVSCTLLASAWSGIDAPYVQSLYVDGLGQSQNGTITVAQNATFEQREMARDAKLAVTGQADGELVISADGEMPDIDIPVYIILLG